MCYMRIVPKRELSKKAQKISEVMEMLGDAQLLKTVAGIGPNYPRLVKEFICNLPSKLNDPDSPDFMKVFVRGHCFTLSPTVINDYLGRGRNKTKDRLPHVKIIVDELSGRDDKEWPEKRLISLCVPEY